MFHAKNEVCAASLRLVGGDVPDAPYVPFGDEDNGHTHGARSTPFARRGDLWSPAQGNHRLTPRNRYAPIFRANTVRPYGDEDIPALLGYHRSPVLPSFARSTPFAPVEVMEMPTCLRLPHLPVGATCGRPPKVTNG